jgi:hypothetical protein
MAADTTTVTRPRSRTLALIAGGVIGWLVLGPLLAGIAIVLIALARKPVTRSARNWLLAGGTASILYGVVFALTPFWLTWLHSGAASTVVTTGGG